MDKTLPGPDGRPRCHWSSATASYLAYHDHEWGFPLGEDFRLFEKLSLEGFQSGLSWRTILEKRENFRNAFAGFDFNRIASFDQEDVARLLADRGIMRHRGKIEAVIHNAARACALKREFGALAAYFWRFEPGAAELGEPMTQSTSPTSIRLSKDLKKRGWKFVGPTTVYAFMQAAGLINDHTKGCAMRAEAEAARARFARPV